MHCARCQHAVCRVWQRRCATYTNDACTDRRHCRVVAYRARGAVAAGAPNAANADDAADTAPHALPITPTPSLVPAPLSAADDPTSAEAELARLINQTRAERGLPPYEISAELSAAARGHSCDLAANTLISHLASDGRTLTQRLEGSQTAWQWPSENIAAGSDDPRVIVGMWMDEPSDGPHLLNILSPDQQAVGTGYCFRADDPSGNQHYWTADFARR